MFKKMKTGMDTKQGKNADKYAVHMLMRVGYNPMGLVRIIKKLEGGDEVHGDPDERADHLKEMINRKKKKYRPVTKIPKIRKRLKELGE